MEERLGAAERPISSALNASLAAGPREDAASRLIARIEELVAQARALVDAAKAQGFTDMVRLADALEQQLTEAAKKLRKVRPVKPS